LLGRAVGAFDEPRDDGGGGAGVVAGDDERVVDGRRAVAHDGHDGRAVGEGGTVPPPPTATAPHRRSRRGVVGDVETEVEEVAERLGVVAGDSPLGEDARGDTPLLAEFAEADGGGERVHARVLGNDERDGLEPGDGVTELFEVLAAGVRATAAEDGADGVHPRTPDDQRDGDERDGWERAEPTSESMCPRVTADG